MGQHVITVALELGDAEKAKNKTWTFSAGDVDKAQDDLQGVFKILQKKKKHDKTPGPFTDMTIAEKVDGGSRKAGGQHSDATFNASLPVAWIDEVVEFFNNVKIK